MLDSIASVGPLWEVDLGPPGSMAPVQTCPEARYPPAPCLPLVWLLRVGLMARGGALSIVAAPKLDLSLSRLLRPAAWCHVAQSAEWQLRVGGTWGCHWAVCQLPTQ